jgi:hypothetical protein
MNMTEIEEKAFRSWKRGQSKQGVYLSLYEGSSSSNWDGSWWVAMWSDGSRDQINVTANKKFDGLSYCRSQATKAAWKTRWEEHIK